MQQNTEIPLVKTTTTTKKNWSRALRLGRKFTFQQDNPPKHTPKTIQEWLEASVSDL